jgi:hypothetical protein
MPDVTVETLEEILEQTPSVKVGEQKVYLDPNRLIFNEQSVGEWLQDAGAWYAYFARQLADAEYLKDARDADYESKYASLFVSYKENGCSDKLADASAKSDEELEEAKKGIARAKHTVKCLQQHLRAWDKAHDSAQNRANTFRKEMEKQWFDPANSDGRLTTTSSDLDVKVDNIIGGAKVDNIIGGAN